MSIGLVFVAFGQFLVGHSAEAALSLSMALSMAKLPAWWVKGLRVEFDDPAFDELKQPPDQIRPGGDAG